MSNAGYVSAGKPKIGGAVFRAVKGTTVPADATSALDAAFKSLGYCGEDGLTNSNTPESDKIKAWGGDTVLSIQKGKEDTFKFKMIESMNAEVLKAVYGSGNVTGEKVDTGIAVKANSSDVEEASWVFDMILKGGVLKRIVVPSGAISEVGEIIYKDDDTIGYEVTITATPDENGNTHYEYIQKKAG